MLILKLFKNSRCFSTIKKKFNYFEQIFIQIKTFSKNK